MNTPRRTRTDPGMSDRRGTSGGDPATADGRIEGTEEHADPTQRVARAVLNDAVAVLGSYLLLGLIGGLLWWLLVDPATFTKVSDGGSMDELDLGKRFNGDGWYAVVAAVTGLVSGVLITWWRTRDFMLTTVLLVAGAGVAAAVMAMTGHLLGPGDTTAALAVAREGVKVPAPLEVTAKASYLVWPISVLFGSLIVLWTPSRDTAD